MTLKRIPILYGTETGTAEYCANLLAEAIQEEGFGAEPVDMGNYPPESIRSQYLVFVITSTYGNGDPPSNAKNVLGYLQKGGFQCAHLKFAVCALGDSSYVYFAQCGKDFEEPFESFKAAVLEYLRANRDQLSDFLDA